MNKMNNKQKNKFKDKHVLGLIILYIIIWLSFVILVVSSLVKYVFFS